MRNRNGRLTKWKRPKKSAKGTGRRTVPSDAIHLAPPQPSSGGDHQDPVTRTIGWPRLFGATGWHVPSFVLVAGSLLASALCGASWMLPIHWIGPALSLGMVALVLLQRSAWARYGTAFAYYAAGSVGLLRGVAVFFGAHASAWEGAFLWLGSSALLALAWALVDRPWKVVLALVFDALVPPLSFFDWLSPLASAGVFYPKAGLFGAWFLLSLFAMWEFPVSDPVNPNRAIPLRKHPQKFVLMYSVLLGGIVLFNLSTIERRPKPAPEHWLGVHLNVGPEVPNLMADLNRRAEWIAETRQQALEKPGTRVVLLPETLSTWWPGTGMQTAMAIPNEQTWLVGVSLPLEPGMLADAIVSVRHDSRPDAKGIVGKVLFRSPLPVPVSMWHPWSRGTGYVRSQNVGYRAYWWEPVQRIEGVRAWASICYDQLLPFVWLEAVIQHPDVILLTNNEWWAKGTGIPTIQRNTAWAWGRLIGVPEIEGENA